MVDEDALFDIKYAEAQNDEAEIRRVIEEHGERYYPKDWEMTESWLQLV